MKLRAAQRLKASIDTNAATEEDAAFDNSRGHELRDIATLLERHGYRFRNSDARLVMMCDEPRIVAVVSGCAECLNEGGWALQVNPGILTRSTYGLKGHDGLVLQRVKAMISIFFTRT